MLFMLLLLPTRMVAQTDYDTSVTFSALAANPEGYDNEKFTNLFDGKKKADNFSKWCGKFDSNKGAYVIFKASKAGVPVGYTITTGNDNANSGCGGRNPKSWKLYGNNEGQNGAWTLIDQVSDDTKLKDVNYASYDFPCKGSASYKYFKWEITAIHSGSTLQVGEFELKLKTSNQAYAEFNNGTLTFKYGPKPAGAYDLNVGGNLPEWVNEELFAKIKKVVFDASFANARPTSCYCWFAGCTELTGIEGIEYLNTEKVTNMSNMFYCCEVLTSLDFTNFNTAEVTDMSYMFMGCSALTSLDLTSFNTAKVTYMHYMFCNCSALTTIYASNKFVTSLVEASDKMFYDCKNLIGAIDKYDENKTDHTYANYKTGYFTPKGGFPGYAVFDEGTGTLTFKWSNSTSIPAGAYELNDGDYSPMWINYNKNINKVVFDASFAKARPTTCYNWFNNFEKLTTIEGIEYLNTEKVTNMRCMFSGCSSLASLNLTSFNTAEVTDMSFMFYECYALASLDVSKFNTAKVTGMREMFHYCYALTSLDLTSFNTANVTDMYRMFNECSALTTIYASEKFVTGKVDDSLKMFYQCDKLVGAIKYDGNKVDHTYANYETGYFTPEGGFHAYAEFDEGTGTLTFRRGLSKPAGAYDLNVGINDPGWLAQNKKIKTVVFDASFACASPTSCRYWFCVCPNLTTIEGIEYLNTEKVTNMNSMFDRCSALTSLDLTSFNTANVTDMSYMFYNCPALTTIYASNKFITSLVTKSVDMFSGCKNLKGAIEYDGNNTNNKDYANYETGYFSPEGGFPGYAVFDEGTGTLTFKWSNSTSIPAGAYDLNVGQSNPKWYDKREKIKKVVFDASFANARPTSCYYWFRACLNLTTIEGIEYLNTEKVTNMKSMFYSCSGLTSLDLSNFNTAKVKNMDYMFNSSSALTTIFVSDKFVMNKVTDSRAMFYGCTNLKGFIDKYDENKKNGTYANYKTGYFTKLVGKNGEEKIGAVGETLTAESLALDDDKDFVAYEPFAATTASYSREMKTGTTWATLCLPFEVSLDGQNFRAFKLLSANDDTETIELEEVKTIEAGTPVIIKMTNGATKLNFSVADKNIAKDVQAAATADGNYQLQGLYTQKEFSKDADNNCYIVKGNKLMNPAKLLENSKVTKVASKPFRAYMVDKSSASAAGAKMFSIGISDSTTAIDSLSTIANDKAEYYDLQGKRLNEPQKGINIVKRNGKTMKVIIK